MSDKKPMLIALDYDQTYTRDPDFWLAFLKLAELKSRPCSLEELQAAVVHLIERHNEQGQLMEAAINRKQDRPWRATL